ncbi:MAG: RecX family transcriptional regulator [Bacteroidetes bacterium]|nr:RecX family transcriptional regulator [Bacteroidota bacterium]
MSTIPPEIIIKIKKYCDYQERCHKEVRNKLYEMGCKTETIGQIIVHLIDAGYLNEERFAKAFAGGKFRTKKWGRLKIRQELKFREITEYCIKKAMNEIDENEYLSVLKELVLKKKIRKNDFYQKQKTIKWLMSKGYEIELIKKAIELNQK